MGKRRTKRRRKGGELKFADVAKLKVKAHRLLENIRDHTKLNAQHKAQLYVGKRPKNKENVRHLTNHKARQAAHFTDALLTNPNANTHVIVGVGENGEKFISDKGGELVKAAAYGAEVGKKHGEQFIKDFKVEQNIKVGLEAGKGGATMLLNEVEKVDEQKILEGISGALKNINFGEYFTGFVRRGKEVFTFVKKKGGNIEVKGSLETIKKFAGDVGSQAGEVGSNVVQGVGNVGSKIREVGSNVAQGVGNIGSKIGEVGSNVAQGLGKMNVITTIKFGGEVIYKGGKFIGEGLKILGRGGLEVGKGLFFALRGLGRILYVVGKVLWPVMKIVGVILGAVIGAALGKGGDRRRTRRKKRKRIKKRKRTKKNKRKRRKKTRRRKSK